MGRLAIRQLLRVPKYLGEMVVIRSQDQLTPEDPRSVSKFGSPFELNLSGWSKPEPRPTIRDLVEGPLPPSTDAEPSSRFGRVGTPQRIDLRRARRRAKYFTHITTMTGGLFSNWKQVSKTMGVYTDFLKNRMDYELQQQTGSRLNASFEPNNIVQQRALDKFRSRAAREARGSSESGSIGSKSGALRLLRQRTVRVHELHPSKFSAGVRLKPMAKKRLTQARRDHEAELKREREKQRRLATIRQKREQRRRAPTRPKRRVLRYRRNMRIGGVIARNKGHAKELFNEKRAKREREMEWEAPAESRPKKKRLVETAATDAVLKQFAVTTLTDGAERFSHLQANS